MKKLLGLISGILIGGCVMAQDVIFQHPSTPDKVFVPQYKNVSCKFTQTKTIPNSQAYVKSGGNFKFKSENGVIFETLYPIKTTTSYTTGQNKRISDIITAVSKKDYSYLNKNFDLFYIKNNAGWKLALKPKTSSKAGSVMNSIIISGGQFINQIDINTLNSGNTNINFTECSVY